MLKFYRSQSAATAATRTTQTQTQTQTAQTREGLATPRVERELPVQTQGKVIQLPTTNSHLVPHPPIHPRVPLARPIPVFSPLPPSTLPPLPKGRQAEQAVKAKTSPDRIITMDSRQRKLVPPRPRR